MSPAKGIFVAPMIGSFVATFLFCLTPEVESHQFVGVLFTYSLVGAVLGWFSAVCFGWPLSKIFEIFKFRKYWQFSVGGVFCALPFTLLWLLSTHSDYREEYGLEITLYFLCVGLVSGLAYWFIVVGGLHTNKSLNLTGAKNAPPS